MITLRTISGLAYAPITSMCDGVVRQLNRQLFVGSEALIYTASSKV
ncbi:MAG TPA: hypothetical protein VEG61_08135 [Candidatus Dormibacteraeota bacterium]|nr:hypothetical protein [Candidatus Dormibacteraeota bacterium]